MSLGHLLLTIDILSLSPADHDFLPADQGLPPVHRGDRAQPAAHLLRGARRQGEGIHAALQRHRRRQEQRLRRRHGIGVLLIFPLVLNWQIKIRVVFMQITIYLRFDQTGQLSHQAPLAQPRL